MTCPICNSASSCITDSRKTGHGIRRRRQCLDCGLRFSTMEIEMENYLQLQQIAENETETYRQLQQIMERHGNLQAAAADRKGKPERRRTP